MSELSRRSFLARAGAGAATAGIVAAVGSVATTAGAAERTTRAGTPGRSATAPTVAAPRRELTAADGPLVVHVPDPSSGEVHYMIGTREVVRTNRALVARLLRDAR